MAERGCKSGNVTHSGRLAPTRRIILSSGSFFTFYGKTDKIAGYDPDAIFKIVLSHSSGRRM
jgi:hypothetical protein